MTARAPRPVHACEPATSATIGISEDGEDAQDAIPSVASKGEHVACHDAVGMTFILMSARR